jgi:hypothetical protein
VGHSLFFVLMFVMVVIAVVPPLRKSNSFNGQGNKLYATMDSPRTVRTAAWERRPLLFDITYCKTGTQNTAWKNEASV